MFVVGREGVAHCRAREFHLPLDNGAEAHRLRITQKPKVKTYCTERVVVLRHMMEHSVGISSGASRPVGTGTRVPGCHAEQVHIARLCSAEQDDRTETS